MRRRPPQAFWLGRPALSGPIHPSGAARACRRQPLARDGAVSIQSPRGLRDGARQVFGSVVTSATNWSGNPVAVRSSGGGGSLLRPKETSRLLSRSSSPSACGYRLQPPVLVPWTYMAQLETGRESIKLDDFDPLDWSSISKISFGPHGGSSRCRGTRTSTLRAPFPNSADSAAMVTAP